MTRRGLGIGSQVVLLAGALAGTAATWRAEDWRSQGLFVVLLVLALASDALAIETKGMHLTGSAIALVLAMCFLGPAPAVILGLATVTLAGIKSVRTPSLLLNNLASYAVFPLVGGILARAAVNHGGAASPGVLALVVFSVYCVSILLNFLLIAGFNWAVAARCLKEQARDILKPLLPAEAALATLVLAFALAYRAMGLVALVVAAVALFAFQALTRALLVSQDRAEQLEVRSTELATLHVGVLASLVQTLSLRDKMTARHSAAVARYSRAMAVAFGCDEAQEDLVHTAALLHDIGKFIFPDRILFASERLTDEDWQIVRKHPAQGARVVGRVSTYGPVAEIIHCHHERIDGKGYPRGLSGEDIPLLSRMISIADTYDVMTARDSYRSPVSRAAAVAELRRVSGTQLDGELVEVFIKVLQERDLSFQHTTDADFERELDLGARIARLVKASTA